ncbi:MAG: ATP-binding protein, partial [Nevskiales bacterium]
MFLVTHRREQVARWQGHGHVTALSLNRLTRAHTAEIVRNVAGSKSLPPEVLGQIVAKTDGVPLFSEELTKTVLESKLLREEADRYVLSAPLPKLAIPTTLQDSLLARLHHLAPIKELVQIGATIGREFSYRMLEALSPAPNRDLDAALAQLAQSELIRVEGTPPNAIYSFKHALVRDTAYSTLLRGRRQELHTRIGQVLEQRFPTVAERQPELVAHHLTEAGLVERAIDWWLKAGERALQGSANVEASRHLSRAIELLNTLPASRKRDEREIEIRTKLRVPLYVTTGYASPEMEANYGRIWILAERLGSTARMLRVLLGQATITLVRSDLARTHEQMRRFMALAQGAGDRNALVAGRHIIGYAHLIAGEIRAARDGLEEAIAAYDRQDADSFLAMYDMNLIPCSMCAPLLAMQQLGYADQAAQIAACAVSDAKQSGHQLTLAYVLYHAALFYMIGGDRSRMEPV